MRISFQKNFVFLAYPRTGSRTIHALLDSHSDIKSVHLSEITSKNPFHHHMTAKAAREVFEKKELGWDRFHRFCVVRNPFARLVSLYLRRVELETRWDNRIRPFSNLSTLLIRFLPEKLGFSFFVLTRNPESGAACNLRAFVFDENGSQLVDTVLRFESLDIELPEYLGQMGIPIVNNQIPRLNQSANRTPYQTWYSPLTKSRIENLYEYEISRFGYQFD